jgi:hypothetical protein
MSQCDMQNPYHRRLRHARPARCTLWVRTTSWIVSDRNSASACGRTRRLILLTLARDAPLDGVTLPALRSVPAGLSLRVSAHQTGYPNT